MRRPIMLLIAAALGGCGASGEREGAGSQDLRTQDVTEAAPSAPDRGRQADASASANGSPNEGQRLPVSAPRIAYNYGYTFRLGSDSITSVQERHLEMCQQLGATSCRVVNLQRSAASGDYSTASTTLQVAAPIARQFGQRLVASAAQSGAETVDRSISGEDLSRQMVDTEARIRTREVLIRRLTQLLETRSGNIAQAVEAERAITAAQEELDAARGWLAEMRTRVDMSTFTLAYQSGAPLAGGIGDPIREAFGAVGSLFARSVAALILLVGIALPWVLIGLVIFYAARRIRRHRSGGAPADQPDLS